MQWEDDLDPRAIQLLLKEEVKKDSHKIVILDDNPTGIQTIRSVPVYTGQSYESIRQGFLEPGEILFILTNSQGFSRPQTIRAYGEIGRRLTVVSRELGTAFVVVNRGGSTLQDHFLLETRTLGKTLGEQMGEEIHGEAIHPFSAEGDRFTMDDVHCVKERERLVLTGGTEFANDKTFGYRSPGLRGYIEEKAGGADRKENVICISAQQLRSVDTDGVEQTPMNVGGFDKVVVDALTSLEIKVFCIVSYRAIAKGEHFLFNTAMGFIKEFATVEDRELLTGRELVPKRRMGGGLVVVGSYTCKTTAQLECLRELLNAHLMKSDSDQMLNPAVMEEKITSVVRQEEACIRQGITAVVYTEWCLLFIKGGTGEQALERSTKTSEAVQQLVGRVQEPSAFIMVRGGATSSDIDTRALGVKRTWVQRQVHPGTPVWRIGPGSRFPHIFYIIFPGNVEGDYTLRDVLQVPMEPWSW